MWIRPWGFKEGCLIGAGLLVTGWLLQITIGEIDWSLFACPVNIIVLVLYIAGIVAMHCLRKRVYFFGWMSHYTSAVSSLLWVAGITVVMGLIRQLPSGHPADVLGFSRMLSAFCIALYLDGDCIGADYASCRISIQMEESCLPFEPCRAVYCPDYGNLGKCRYAAGTHDYPDR